MALYVVNGGKKELVTHLSFASDGGALRGDIVVTDYTRDAAILGFRGAPVPALRLRALRCAPQAARGDSDRTNLADFASYLGNRKKAAVAKYDGGVIHLLPPAGEAKEQLDALFPAAAERSRTRIAPVVVKRELQGAAPRAAGGAGGAAGVASMMQRVSSGGVHRGGEVTDKRVRPTVDAAAMLGESAHAAAVAEAHRVQNRVATLANTTIVDMRTSIREKLEAFVARDEEVRLAFPPMMDRMDRYLVHEACDELEGLMSKSDGEGAEKHVVVYKDGHMPEEEADVGMLPPAMLAAQERQKRLGAARRRREQEKQRSEMIRSAGNAIGGGIEVVQRAKRDRRTIEEIEADRRASSKQKLMSDLFGDEDGDG